MHDILLRVAVDSSLPLVTGAYPGVGGYWPEAGSKQTVVDGRSSVICELDIRH